MGEVERGTRKHNNKNKRIIRKFLRTMFMAMAVFFGAFVLVAGGLYLFGGHNVINQIGSGVNTIKNGSILDIFAAEEERTNFLIVGLDEDGTRTDVMMLGTFDPATERVDLISLPRDIKVTMPQMRYDVLAAEGKQMNSDRTMKLNEVHHHAGKEKGMEYLELQLEEMLGVNIDFYVKIDLDAFRYIVDEIGGVEFDVPQRMYYYDPTVNFLIDLQPGMQRLYGADAESLVRFRTYPQADLMRVEVQQAFIRAMVEQTLAKENLVSNAQTMIMAALKYVETDFDMLSLPGYLKYLTTFSVNNLNTYTLPTKRDTSGSAKSYILLDTEAAALLIDNIFFNPDAGIDEPSHDKSIQILNGGEEEGLARRAMNMLQENGFMVESIGDYGGVKENQTRIFVRSSSYGKDIQALFENSRIIYDPAMGGEYDIMIVVGIDGLDG